MKLDPFRVVLAAGGVIALALVLFQVTASDRQHARAKEAGLSSVDLRVPQIRCSMCKADILHALRQTPGVVEITTLRNGLTIAYDPANVSPKQLVRVIRRTGYDAALAFAQPPAGPRALALLAGPLSAAPSR